MAWFHLPIIVLFGMYHLGWSYAQVGSVIWAQLSALFVFDFLGGFIADRFGRKKTCIIGACTELAAFLPFVLTPSYPLLLLASVGIGIGRALQSTVLDTLIYEQAASLGVTTKYHQAAALTNMFQFASRAVTSFIGGIAFTVSPTLPYWLTIVALAFGLVATLSVKVTSVSKVPDSWRAVRSAFATYRNNRTVLKFVVIAGVAYLLANVLFGMYQPFYIEMEVSAQTLGGIMAAIAAASGAGALLMRWLSSRYSAHAILSVVIIAHALTGIALLILPMPFVVAAPMSMAVVSGFASSELAYIHEHTPNSVRASVQSIYSSIKMLGLLAAQIIVFSLVGLLSHTLIIGVTTIGLLIVFCFDLHWRKIMKPETPLVSSPRN